MTRILIKGIVKYERKVALSRLDKSDKKYKPLHQPSGNSLSRFRRKMLARQKWFKEKKGEDGEDVSLFGNLGMNDGKSKQAAKTSKKQGIEQSTVMFVPSTIRSLLLKMLKEKEDEMAALTGGSQLGRMFNQNLARDRPCGRLDC